MHFGNVCGTIAIIFTTLIFTSIINFHVMYRQVVHFINAAPASVTINKVLVINIC